MTDPIKPPVVTPIDAAEDALEHDEDSSLPEHERREDRGTGSADARKADDDAGVEAPPDSAEVVPTSHLPR